MSETDVKPGKVAKSPLWGHIPSVIALLSVGASLYGYGVVTGLASSVNLDQGTLLAGAFDLITLVWPGMLAIISVVNDLPWLQILLEVLRGASGPSLAIGVVVFCVAIAVRFKPVVDSVRSAISSGMDRFRAYRSANAAAVVVAVFAALVAFVGSMTATLLGTLVLFGVLMGLTVLPSFGYLSGQAFVQKIVVEPAICASTQSRRQRLDRQAELDKARQSGRTTKPAAFGAACVLVTSVDPTKPFQRFGRSVIGSGSSILIWDPESGQGDRIPTASMMVTSIDEAALQGLLAEKAKRSGQRSTNAESQPPGIGEAGARVK